MLPSGQLTLPFGVGMRIALLAGTITEEVAETLRVMVDIPDLEKKLSSGEALVQEDPTPPEAIQ